MPRETLMLEDWTPMPPHLGPPLPLSLGIYWPWLKSYCAYHDGVLELGPDWTEPGVLWRNRACNPKIPGGAITGATWTQLPSGLWVMSFDGSPDRVNCGSDESFDITNAITLECWVNLDDQTGIDPLIDKDLDGTNYPYMIWCDDGNPELRSYDSGALFSAVSPDKLVAGTWYHIVGTFDKTLPSANAKIFVNTIQKGTANYTSPLPTNTAVVNVGYYSGYYAGCDIALPRIYNRALDATERQDHFAKEHAWFGV